MTAAADQPQPRPQRRRRRAKADRGLPSDTELARLATEYLARQRRHWPELVRAGLLPEPTADVVDQMVDLKNRHRTGHVDLDVVRAYHTLSAKLGGSYSRYSCDNSSP